MADFTQLDAAITEAETKVQMDYTPRSWILLEHSLEASKTLRSADPEPEQDTVDVFEKHLVFNTLALVDALGCNYPMDDGSACTINGMRFTTHNNTYEQEHRRVVISANGLGRKEAIVSPCSAAIGIDADWDATLQLLRFSPWGNEESQPYPVVTFAILDTASSNVVLETKTTFTDDLEVRLPIVYNAALNELTVGSDIFPMTDIASKGWRLFLGMDVSVDNNDASTFCATIDTAAPVTGNTLCDVMLEPFDEENPPGPGEPLSPEWLLPRVHALIDEYAEVMGETNLVTAPFGVKMHVQLNYAISLALLHDNAAQSTDAMDYIFDHVQNNTNGAFSQKATGRFDTLFLTMHPSAFLSYRAALKLIYQTLTPGNLLPWLDEQVEDDMERILGRTRAERLWWYLTRR